MSPNDELSLGCFGLMVLAVSMMALALVLAIVGGVM